MSSMTTSRFILFFPSPEISGTHDDHAPFVERLPGLGLTVQRKHPYLFACETKGNGKTPLETVKLWVDIYAGTAASGRSFDFDLDRDHWQNLHDAMERKAQIYNLIETRDAQVRIESDFLGLKPFYLSQLSTGLLIASQIQDMIRIFPSLAAPVNSVALQELLVSGLLSAELTLHQKIKRSVTGGCYRWDVRSGLSVNRERRFVPPAVDAAISTAVATKKLEEAVSSNFLKRTRNGKVPVRLALSGGYDSRWLGALMKKFGIPILSGVTYGKPYHRELHIASKVAKVLKIKHDKIPYTENNLIQSLPFHLKTIEAQSDLGSAQIQNLIRTDYSQGTALVHGFLLGSLAGHYVKTWFKNGRDWTPKQMAAVASLAIETSQVTHLQKYLGGRVDFETYRSFAESNISANLQPYQSLIFWELENRQRRLIAAHFQQLGTKFDMILPAYDRKVIELWLSLPCMALDTKGFYRTVLERTLPALAEIPHANETHPIRPNLKNQIPLFLEDLFRKRLPQKLLGQKLYNRIRKPDIEFLWSGLTPAQRNFMKKRLGECVPYLKSMLSLDLTGLPDKILEKQSPCTLRNLFMLGEYAQKLSTYPKVSRKPEAAAKHKKRAELNLKEVILS